MPCSLQPTWGRPDRPPPRAAAGRLGQEWPLSPHLELSTDFACTVEALL